MTDKTPEEQDVLDAASIWRGGSGSYEAANKLRKAVDALRASRKPRWVKPEECEILTQFWFECGSEAVFELLNSPNGPVFKDDDGWVGAFAPDDRIIPIQEEEEGECEHEWPSRKVGE